MKTKNILTFLILLFHLQVFAQDTLPEFSLLLRKDGFANVAWQNDFGIVKQITIQRSKDSLKNFLSIFTMPNPMSKENSYLDKKSDAQNYYYRIYIHLPEGEIIKTSSKKPVLPDLKAPQIQKVTKNPDKVKPGELNPEKIKPFIPSKYIFTDKKNNVLIVLPDAESKAFSVVFFDKNNNELFRIPKVKETSFILEKYNFMRSGWYFFELFENNNLLERNKFQITKD